MRSNSVFVGVCLTQKCVTAQLHFMGKSVSHHCVLASCQTLTRLVVCVWGGIVVAGFSEQHRKRLGSDRVGAFMVKTGSSSKPVSVRQPLWTGCIFPLSVVVGCWRPSFDFWVRRFQAWLSLWCEWQWRAAGLHAMGCAFSLPEDRRDAAERSVKVFDLLLLLMLKKDKSLQSAVLEIDGTDHTLES